jgi:hypothetical protein
MVTSMIRKRRALNNVLISIRNYVRLAAPELEVLRILGEESKRHGTYRLTARQIDRIISATRQARHAQASKLR